jgi:hypothetical protein
MPFLSLFKTPTRFRAVKFWNLKPFSSKEKGWDEVKKVEF